MSKLAALRSAENIYDLAKILGYKPQALAYIVYRIPDESKYSEFSISKQSGGRRIIKAPTNKLKRLQRTVANLLTDCLSELENSRQRKTPFSHGFTRGRSIATNAKTHRNKKWLLNFDIQDFFGSINYGRVRGILIKDRNFEIHPKVATLIAQIACHQNSLPQGAPTSPILSNMVARPFDLKLVGLAKKYGCAYTRYADDVTLSSNKESHPDKLINKARQDNSWELSKEISNLLRDSGFQENIKKTRLLYNRSRQVVTGLVVNKRINVSREYRKLVRSMVDRLVKTGAFDFPEAFSVRSGNNKIPPNPIKQLQGMLGYIDWVDMFAESRNKNLYLDDLRKSKNGTSYKLEDLSSQEKTYRKFLFYQNFYATQEPTIITEGKTDKEHLRIAINKLSENYPDLIDVNVTPKKLKFRILPSIERRTFSVMGITGGTANLGEFLKSYKGETKKFVLPQLSNPVIVLVDHDSGLDKIRKHVKGISDDQGFFHIYANLYVVCIPLPNGKDKGAIEDLYQQNVLDEVLEGKSFNSSNKVKDEGKHYGKVVFVEKIVKLKSHNIDFSGFRPLFDRLRAVIQYHKQISISNNS